MQGSHPIPVVALRASWSTSMGSRGPHPPYSRPFDYHYHGPYSSQGQHIPPRGRYGAGWDHIPPHSGPYSYYGKQGAQTFGPLPHPSGYAPSPVLGGPPSSQVSYDYGQSHGPEYGNAAPYSQTGHQQAYMQMYEQLKYDSNPPPVQPPFGGSYPPVGGGQPKLFPSAAT